MNPIIDAYRNFPAGAERETALREALSSEQVQNAVNSWLMDHESLISSSPFLQDLEGRVRHIEAAESYCGLSRVFNYLFGKPDVEGLILSKDLQGLEHYLRNNPDEFWSNLGLLKMHLELNTISINELLPILTAAAGSMMQPQSRPYIDDNPFLENEPTPYPSIFAAFSSELKNADDLEALVKQDEVSLSSYLADPKLCSEFCSYYILQKPLAAIPFLKRLPVDVMVKFLKTKDSQDNSPLHYPDTLQALLPFLLDTLSMDDLDTLIHRNYKSDGNTAVVSKFDNVEFSKLSKSQQLRLGSLLAYNNSFGMYYAWCGPRWIENSPVLKNHFLFLMRHRTANGSPYLNENDPDKLVQLIEDFKLPLRELGLSRRALLLAAPKLRYADFEGFQDESLMMEMLSQCRSLDYLSIKNWRTITKVPANALANCQTLICTGCTNLQLPPVLPQCHTFTCNRCSTWESLPALPLCKELNCESCTGLREIPPLPLCQILRCGGTNLRQLPEVPFSARVITCILEEVDFFSNPRGLAFTKLEVDFDQLSNEPIKVLLDLGEKHLLQHMPFPNIYYFSNGKLNEAIDIGGVRRDFVTRLSENLLKGGLHLEDGLPVDEDQEACYRTLGALFAHCYPVDSYFKTGPLFSNAAYRCMAAPGVLGSEEWLLSNYLHLIKAPASAFQIVDLEKPSPVLSDGDRLLLTSHDNNAGIGDVYGQEYFNDLTNRQNLRAALLEEAKEDKRLKAISFMADEMKKILGEEEWASLQLFGGDALKERVEGVLSAEALLKKLVWQVTPNVDKEHEERTKTFLINWINGNKNNLDQLSLFVRAVTGNKTLGPDPLVIQIQNLEQNYIPAAHTCSFSLDLPANYPNQHHFNMQLKKLLTEGLAGQGFQMA